MLAYGAKTRKPTKCFGTWPSPLGVCVCISEFRSILMKPTLDRLHLSDLRLLRVLVLRIFFNKTFDATCVCRA